jgi:DNA-directed RNA polymerase specialized sigma24 family protein
VAAMLGRPEGTVKADLYQARSRLRAALGENGA